MSQQNGVSSLASIETTPPSHAAPITSSHPTAPLFEQRAPANIEQLSGKIPSNPNLPSSTVSSKVQIPKLSAATTELLARVTGNIKEEKKRDDNKFASWNSSLYHNSLNSWDSREANKMKASSAIIELPTAPFVCSNTAVASDIPQHIPTPSQENHLKSTGLITLAPKPAGPSSKLLATSTNIQSVSQSQPTAPVAKNTSSAKQQKAPAAPRQRRSITKGNKRLKKRRRGDDSDGEGVIRAGESSSDESDIAPSATQTKSGRQVHRPSLYVPPAAPSPVANKEKSNSLESSDITPTQTAVARKRKRVYRKGKELNVNCIHCERGHSPLSNAIVFCDECNGAWHQLCHDPPIDNEVVTVQEKEWLCRECKPVQNMVVHPTVVRSNPSQSSGPLGPSLRPSLTMPQAEVGGEGFSVDERRGYLSSLSHATLVELLVTISDSHLSIPIFPENMRALQTSNFSFQSSTSMAPLPSLPHSTNTPAATAPAHEPTNPPLADQQDSIPNPNPPPSASSSQRKKKKKHHDDSDESEYEEFQEHRLYPRAGNGFRLSLNVEDLDIMRDDSACPTFSYALHGPAKARAEANVMPPVWGTA
ncbi:hypothetical protein ASPWEDRAFT_415826 [Aspergillus wentii DTO 134E9]|uniref:PHD-type domain-containing protein n=1 Tax=Aspergillus wentii DTO 134E9 TaxID=1073089 RepID=A0A1L9RNW6_ASPWE|nr:uncharacterized protein ASPWEDRAFT_415826 [Aspergillus wentii DTO 134E9]KAI9934221.1 hypothetical protein MW887_005295 [Aspergillus wentii]OJJ36639.1 hypothetical protein ASPWEDRAFT_415826 [Aspergillus wentii DTO 134E9]